MSNRVKEGFDPKNSTFLLFLCFLSGPTLNKMVTLATTKSLSMISNFENLASTYLQRVATFQGDGSCRFGILRHVINSKFDCLYKNCS